MRSLTEPASSLRVLMRMPDLSPAAATSVPTPAPEIETFVQKPLEPLTAKSTPVPAKTLSKLEQTGVMPEELKTPGMFARPLTVLAVLAVAAAVGVALSQRARQKDTAAEVPKHIAEIVSSSVPGGSPTEITQIPEISFPDSPESSAPAAEPKLTIERLPAVGQSNTAQSPVDGAMAQVSDNGPSSPELARQPGVATLNRSIEQPKPQATHDSSRQGLY